MNDRIAAWGDELIKLHDGFRRDLAALRESRMDAADLRTHCLTFCDALHAHHEGEDGALFPPTSPPSTPSWPASSPGSARSTRWSPPS
ncbi:hemerythrin domain-containing protein [Nonomuraea salmonea]|uniref:hemerythrin domain-containing protein n=1 Tax=Nonomuraea salmonea TaxID=46181 RepID=UPI002FE780FA